MLHSAVCQVVGYQHIYTVFWNKAYSSWKKKKSVTQKAHFHTEASASFKTLNIFFNIINGLHDYLHVKGVAHVDEPTESHHQPLQSPSALHSFLMPFS